MKKIPSNRRTPRLGQHFLNNPVVARTLVEAAGIAPGDTVVEIGPGTGALTGELLKTEANVLAIEKDESLVAVLHKKFESEIQTKQLTIVADDVRNFDPTSHQLQATGYVLAANIPYYITGEIIRQFLTASAQPKTIALLIQKEVAERIVARDGKESILSLSVKAYGVPKVVRKVSAGNFTPPPSVDSAILAITYISRDFFQDLGEEKFFSVVRAGFSSKRKVLRSNLNRIFPRESVEKAFLERSLKDTVRAEDLSLNDWRVLACAL